MKTLRLLMPLAFFSVHACANLPDVATDACGNRVIDSNEDCDTFAIGAALCGAAGAPNQCRLLCTHATDCPASWGCGTDGVCRAPSGNFSPAFDPIASGAVRLQLGDFDADGQQDLFAGSATDSDRATIYYFSANAQVSTSLAVEASMRAPEVVRFAGSLGDANDDVVFVSDTNGIDALLGQGDRTIVPVAYPTILPPGQDLAVFPIASDPARGQVPVSGSSIGVGVIIGKDSANNQIFQPLLIPGGASVELRLPTGFGLSARADIIDGLVAKVLPGSACGELVLLVAPQGGSPELDILPICYSDVNLVAQFNAKTLAEGVGLTPTRVDLSSLRALKATPTSIAVGDMDGDKAVDVVVNLTAVDGAAAHNSFVYSLKSTAFTELKFQFKDASGVVHVDGTPAAILTTADMNNDGMVDFVTTDDVVVGGGRDTSGTPLYYSVAHNPGDSWSQAIAVDFNGDDIVDIAASSPSRTDIDFLIGGSGGFFGGGTGFFSAGTLDTDGVVTRLTNGDYDGDGITDLGALSRPSADAAGGEIFIAYGKRQGLPETPARVASFAIANDLPSLRTFAVDFMGVVGNTTISAQASTDVALLVGDADRFPIAPKSLGTVLANHPLNTSSNAVAVFAGALTKSGETDVGAFFGDLQKVASTGAGLAVATASDTQFQGNLQDFVPLVDLGSAGNPVFGSITAMKGNRYLANATVPLATGDIDGDGILEAYVVSGNVNGLSAAIKRMNVNSPSTALTPFADAPQRLGVAGKLALVDIDGDGALDLVYVSGFDSVAPGRVPGESTTVTGTSVMTVFFNNGTGTLATTGVPVGALTVTNASAAPSACATFANPTAVAEIRAFESGAHALAVLTSQCVYIAAIDKTGAGTAKSLTSAPLTIGFSLVAGDMNGDGVDEIGYLDDRSIAVLKQAPVRP